MKGAEKVLSYLADEESKFIYQKRVEYNETGNFDAIKAIVDRYLPELKDKSYYPGIEDNMVELLRRREKIVIFGSGMNGRQVLQLLARHRFAVECIADNDESKWGTELAGTEIRCPQDIDFRNVDAIVITPYEQIFVDEISNQLIALGAVKESLVYYKDYCPTMLEKEQYFDSGIIKLQENEVFVDGGVLNLGTSLRFAEECRNSHIKNFKIHAFEPDNTSYQRCLELLESMPDLNLKLYHAGLWSKETTLYFEEMGNGASRITQKETKISINTVSLDHSVSDKVTFIKMDIEGAELEALKGCSEIIQKDKPRLAICIYHKKEDLVEIPMFIKKLVPEYELYVRHYSNDAGETVLYAVPFSHSPLA